MQHRRIEASLDELFSDAIARLLMARDGVAEAVVRQLLRDVQQARRQAHGVTTGCPAASLTQSAQALTAGVAG
jgi:hypothetical protein